MKFLIRSVALILMTIELQLAFGQTVVRVCALLLPFTWAWWEDRHTRDTSGPSVTNAGMAEDTCGFPDDGFVRRIPERFGWRRRKAA